MEPSRYMRDWYAGLALGVVNCTWREYMIQAFDTGYLQAFVQFTDGPSIHELAHLIAVPDKHVFDPWWGIPPDGRFEDPISKEEIFYKEVEVVYIQALIDEWCTGHSGNDRAYALAYALMHVRKRDRHVWYNDQELKRYLYCMQPGYQGPGWDIHTVWNELCRKKQLIAAGG